MAIKFEAAYTATVTANRADIWAIWSDPGKWEGLDDGNLLADSSKGAFRPGSVIHLKLRSGQTVDVRLTKVLEGQAFSDETKLPYGVVRTEHKMEESGKNLIISYAIHAEIAEDSADAFSKEYWPNLLEGIPHQVHNVTALAKAA
jgi:hypothetical protein